MKLYKVLNNNMASPFRGYKYEFGKKYVCQNFDTDPKHDCSKGFYATDVDGLVYSYRPGKSVYAVKVGGQSVEIDQFKRRYEAIEIIREIKDVKGLVKRYLAKSPMDYDYYHALFPVLPLHGRPKTVTDEDIRLLNDWISVVDSVRASVLDSVWASVLAYMSGLFPNIEKWKYIDHEPGINPFNSAITLWSRGFVPSFDGQKWRLHSGEKAEIVYTQNESRQ